MKEDARESMSIGHSLGASLSLRPQPPRHPAEQPKTFRKSFNFVQIYIYKCLVIVYNLGCCGSWFLWWLGLEAHATIRGSYGDFSRFSRKCGPCSRRIVASQRHVPI